MTLGVIILQLQYSAHVVKSNDISWSVMTLRDNDLGTSLINAQSRTANP